MMTMRVETIRSNKGYEATMNWVGTIDDDDDDDNVDDDDNDDDNGDDDESWNY